MINAKQTVGEIAGRQPSTIEVFERLGIQYCCHGEETVEAACEYLGLPVNGVLSELNRVANANSTTKAPWADPILEALMEICFGPARFWFNKISHAFSNWLAP